MKNRILGHNDLRVSSLGLGCWGMSHAYGNADEKESLATINHCLDSGINFLDTADVYGDGHNEVLIGKILKQRRNDVVIATKFGFVGDEHGNVAVNGRPEYVRGACEKSLHRLGVDVIDLYYLHRLDPDVPIEETIGAMADLVDRGWVRYIGLSEVSAEAVRRAHAVHPITALQSEYSLWHRDVEETILPVCRELNISLVPFSPLGRGFLTGTILTADDLEPEDYRRQIPRFASDTLRKNHGIIERLGQLAKKTGASPSQLCLGWLLAQGDFIVPIPGTKRRQYVDENIGAVELVIPPEIIDELNALGQAVHGDRHNRYNLKFIDTAL